MVRLLLQADSLPDPCSLNAYNGFSECVSIAKEILTKKKYMRQMKYATILHQRLELFFFRYLMATMDSITLLPRAAIGSHEI